MGKRTWRKWSQSGLWYSKMKWWPKWGRAKCKRMFVPVYPRRGEAGEPAQSDYTLFTVRVYTLFTVRVYTFCVYCMSWLNIFCMHCGNERLLFLVQVPQIRICVWNDSQWRNSLFSSYRKSSSAKPSKWFAIPFLKNPARLFGVNTIGKSLS